MPSITSCNLLPIASPSLYKVSSSLSKLCGILTQPPSLSEVAPPPLTPVPEPPPSESLGVVNTFNSSRPCNCCFNFFAESVASSNPSAKSSVSSPRSEIAPPPPSSYFHPKITPKLSLTFCASFVKARITLFNAMINGLNV